MINFMQLTETCTSCLSWNLLGLIDLQGVELSELALYPDPTLVGVVSPTAICLLEEG